jgi:hypothetical protein
MPTKKGEYDRLFKQRIKEKEEELDAMRLKKERDERVKKEKERVERELEIQDKIKKEKAKKEQARIEQIIKDQAKADFDRRELEFQKFKKEKVKHELFESFYGSEDEILKSKKEVKYLFIYQIEDEGITTEELSPTEIEERIDKFGLSRNNYVIVTNGKVVDFPLKK